MPSGLSDKLWGLANSMTAFNVAQAMAYVYAIGNPTFSKQISRDGTPWVILALGIILNSGWIAAIWWCHVAALRCPPDEGVKPETIEAFKRISLVATLGRVTIVVVFTAMSISWAFVVH